MLDRLPRLGYIDSNVIVNSGIFLLGAASLVLPSGYSLGAFLLVIAGIFALASGRASFAFDWIFMACAIMAIYALSFLFEGFWRGEGIRDFDRPSRFLLAILAFYAVKQARIQIGSLWIGAAVGAIGAAVFSIWQVLIMSESRAGGSTMIIQFGNISLVLGILSAVGLGWALRHPFRRFAYTALIASGALSGVLASLLSGTRGGWLALPAIIAVMVYEKFINQRPLRAFFYGLLLLIAVLVVFSALPQTGVQSRIDNAVHGLSEYLETREPEGNLGSRLEMWRGAWVLFTEKPLLGWGEIGYVNGMLSLSSEGVIHSYVANFTHAHNEFLNTLAKRGLVGVAILLPLFLVPALVFYRGLGSPSADHNDVALAGLLLVTMFSIFGLTQVSFNHNSGVMIYAFYLAVLLGALNNTGPTNDSDYP